MDKEKPKGITYVNLSIKYDSEIDIAMAIQEGLGWKPDPVIDSNERNYNNSLLVSILRLIDLQQHLYERL